MALLAYVRSSSPGDRKDQYDSVVTWRPSVHDAVPPNKGKKYVTYAMFHWVRMFRNQDYCWIALEQDSIKASMLCVPAYFRWPFMEPDDIQFTYVMTTADERGKGWGSRLVQAGLGQLAKSGRRFWYVTDSDNTASQKLALHSGFELAGEVAYSRGPIKRLKLAAS